MVSEGGAASRGLLSAEPGNRYPSPGILERERRMAVRYEFSPAEGAGAGERSREIARAAAGAQRYLLSIQDDDGHWCAELEGDTILESEYILTMYFLGRGAEP